MYGTGTTVDVVISVVPIDNDNNDLIDVDDHGGAIGNTRSPQLLVLLATDPSSLQHGSTPQRLVLPCFWDSSLLTNKYPRLFPVIVGRGVGSEWCIKVGLELG